MIIKGEDFSGLLDTEDGTIYEECTFDRVIFPETVKDVRLLRCKLTECNLSKTTFGDLCLINDCLFERCTRLQVRDRSIVTGCVLRECSGVADMNPFIKRTWWRQVMKFLRIGEPYASPSLITACMFYGGSAGLIFEPETDQR